MLPGPVRGVQERVCTAEDAEGAEQDDYGSREVFGESSAVKASGGEAMN